MTIGTDIGRALLTRLEDKMRQHARDWRGLRHEWPDAATYHRLQFRTLHGLRRQARFDADWSQARFMRADLNRQLPATSLPPDRHEEAWAPGEVMEAWGK
jgi:hypothetical protein